MDTIARLDPIDQLAASEAHAAHQRYLVALQQCTDFAVSGAVPDELFATE
jgi:hypothetical protein